MNKRIQLDESSEGFQAIKKEWQERAHKMTIPELPSFLTELTEKYSHDYGTICHAVAVAAIAAAWAVEHSPQGGITGFQAGAIMWEFIRGWNYSYNKTGLRLIDYDNFLYPQYAGEYDKVISPDIWDGIQKEASRQIEEADQKHKKYLADMEQYKKDIAAFVEKYPDYYERCKHYDPLSIGNGEQWKAEEEKKASGFEFAPQPPYEPVNSDSPVYKHWQSIVNGIIPFGYRVEES